MQIGSGLRAVYSADLNPHRIAPALLSAGLKPPTVRAACELAFGAGDSIAAHASASDVRWYGCESDAGRVAEALDATAGVGRGPELSNAAVEDFCAREDLPEFDFVGLQGTWPSLGPAQRRAVVDFLDRRLRPGGVFFVSYGVYPGWGDMLAMRHLLREYTERMTPAGMPATRRAAAGLGYLQEVLAANPELTERSPLLGQWIDGLRADGMAGALECLGARWHCTHFAEVSDQLRSANLQFACSADLHEHAEASYLPTEQLELLRALGDPVLRETVDDVLAVRAVRRDYWVKGARPIAASERVAEVDRVEVVLLPPPDAVSRSVRTDRFEAEIDGLVLDPLMAVLGDQKPHSIGELVGSMAARPIERSQIVQVLYLLLGSGELAIAQGASAAAAAAEDCERFNLRALAGARQMRDRCIAAAPVTGGGVELGWIDQACLLSRIEGGVEDVEEWARFALEILHANKLHLRIGGALAETREQDATEMLRLVREFADQRLPSLAALGVVS